MKKNLYTTLYMFLAVFFIGTVVIKAQETLTHKSGLKVTVPAYWMYEIEDEDVFMMTSPDDQVVLTVGNIGSEESVIILKYNVLS